MHLFMITSGNRIGINISELFLFLLFDPEGEKWHPTSPRTPFSHEVIKTSIFHFACPEYLSILLFQFYTHWHHITNYYHRVIIARPKLWWRNNVCGAPGDRWIKGLLQTTSFAQQLLECPDRPKFRAVGQFSHIWSWEVPRSIGASGLVADQTICGKMPWSDERLEIWRMGWESTNFTGNWNGSGTGPVARSHHRANRTRSGTVPLRSDREVVGSFRNDRTQWNRCEHGRPVAFRNRSGPKAVVWTRP